MRLKRKDAIKERKVYLCTHLCYRSCEKLMSQLLFPTISREILTYYIPDIINYFSMPENIQLTIEKRFCFKYTETGITSLFDLFHSLGDEPSECDEAYKFWHKAGMVHRLNDLPAIEYHNNIKIWVINGLTHRDNDKPAYICKHKISNITEQQWFQDGRLHRENDQPAILKSNGTRILKQIWYFKGKKHRDNDLPSSIRSSGIQTWYKHGRKHRDNGQPAFISSQKQIWFCNGSMHRDDPEKPAYVNINGIKEYYQHGDLINVSFSACFNGHCDTPTLHLTYVESDEFVIEYYEKEIKGVKKLKRSFVE